MLHNGSYEAQHIPPRLAASRFRESPPCQTVAYSTWQGFDSFARRLVELSFTSPTRRPVTSTSSHGGHRFSHLRLRSIFTRHLPYSLCVLLLCDGLLVAPGFTLRMGRQLLHLGLVSSYLARLVSQSRVRLPLLFDCRQCFVGCVSTRLSRAQVFRWGLLHLGLVLVVGFRHHISRRLESKAPLSPLGSVVTLRRAPHSSCIPQPVAQRSTPGAFLVL